MNTATLEKERRGKVRPQQRWMHLRAAIQHWWRRPSRGQWDRAFAQAFTGRFSNWAMWVAAHNEGQAFVACRNCLAVQHTLVRPNTPAESAFDLYQQAQKLLGTALETTKEGGEILAIYHDWQNQQA